ncbi:ACP S-malonyltransferase [Paenibacillus donghaensis]|uniref:ACP S-malonyltransferase n=1 Tax=Paenibacillus donghaensis TaxID=414771 RepID=UPI00188330D3|nr:ACP S-malonyltransferase [Paenibacillus donghaensis]MBE9913475.1 ACP S-malonyltransferase [Paenibacillus donghaensis]
MTVKLAMLFPGSGSQYKGMMRSLYESSPSVKQTLDEADRILGMELSRLMMTGNTVKLNRIRNILPAICAASVAHFRLYMEQTGIEPAFMAGHSLGEYSALICSGALSFEDGLKLVQFRAALAEEIMESTGGGMSIMNQVNPDRVTMLCEQLNSQGREIGIACLNSPTQAAVSGMDDALKELEQQITDEGGKVTFLIGSAPYHCSLMRPQAEKMANELQKYRWQMPTCPILSNVTGRLYQSVEEILHYLPQQLFRPVLWHKSIRYLAEQNASVFLEMGPQNVLKTLLVEEASGSYQAYAHDEKADRVKIAGWGNNMPSETRMLRTNSGSKLDGDNRLKALTMCLTHAVTTRNHDPRPEAGLRSLKMYDQVKQFKQEIDANRLMLSNRHLDEAFAMLQAVFEDKQTPLEERKLRIQQIRDKTGIGPSLQGAEGPPDYEEGHL